MSVLARNSLEVPFPSASLPRESTFNITQGVRSPCYVPLPEFFALLAVYSSPRLCGFISRRLRSWDSPSRVFSSTAGLVLSDFGYPPAVTFAPDLSTKLQNRHSCLRVRLCLVPFCFVRRLNSLTRGVSLSSDPRLRSEASGFRRSSVRQAPGLCSTAEAQPPLHCRGGQ